MYRNLSTSALVFLAALGSVTVATAQESKETGGKVKNLPKELSLDLGKGVKLEMVLIPPGEFLMGSPDSDKDAGKNEKPQHRVRITRPFYLGKYLVTQEQWKAVTNHNPSCFLGPKNPVEQVTWDKCQEFLTKLEGKLGTAGEVRVAYRGPVGIRLPGKEHDDVLLWRRRGSAWRLCVE